MPPYIVKEMSTKEELDQIVEIVWEAQYSPYMPSASLFFPIFGATDTDRQTALELSKERLWKRHQANSDSHVSRSHLKFVDEEANVEDFQWIYVEDTETNQIVAGTQWEFHESNPFTSNTLQIPVSWWPEGEGRSFCEAMLRQAYTPRFLWMKRPHTGESILSLS